MKFFCTQQNLSYGLSIAEKIIGKNLTLPILQNILITCKNNSGYITISATDLETGVEVNIPAKIEKEGSITVPAKLLAGFVRNLPEENIEFTEKNKKIYISCKNYKANIKGEDSKDFPLIPNKNNTETFKIKKDIFLSGISSVINSTSLLDIKPEIKGVYVQFNEGDICFAATDTFRLSEKIIKTNKKNTFLNKIILPRKTCDTILRIFQDIEEDLILTRTKFTLEALKKTLQCIK